MAKPIMAFREQSMSRKRIASMRYISMESVCEVFVIAAERNLLWEDVSDLSDDETYRLLFPGRQVRKNVLEQPDWDYVLGEVSHVGVTLKLLHSECRDGCGRSGKMVMFHGKFCEDYGDLSV